MNDLEIYAGINVITETRDTLIEGVSHFTLKWANQLAQTHKVLYISWETDIEDSLQKLQQMGDFKAENLTIDTRSDYNFFVEFFKIYEQVKIEQFEIIVFNEESFFYDVPNKELEIEALFNFLVKKLNVKVLFSLPINLSWKLEPAVIRVNIRDYEMPRKIMNMSSQILFLHRPFVHTFNPDNKIIIDSDELEIISLKNKELKEFSIKLDNTKLKIF